MTHVEKHQPQSGKETIHSGHFMVSHFEDEAQDEFDDLAVPVPDEEQVQKVSAITTYSVPGSAEICVQSLKQDNKQQLSIEISLTKLFKCMSLAYRQKLTSPKWNRFKGMKLRWKDKIRLNNVIWRCWHMQFIKKQNTLVCQFASPLDVDTHVKPETTILEGKYWKRRAEAVIAEYKKWRMYHIMRLLGKGDTSVQDSIMDMDTVESQCSELAGNMLTDEDYLNFMSDTLFSTITNHQPFAFPDPREIARGASLADFIQPSLGPLQPNLEDFMDTLEPLQDFLPRLAPVPEESALPGEDHLYQSTNISVDTFGTVGQSYITTNDNSANVTMPTNQMSIHGTSSDTQMLNMQDQSVKNDQMHIYGNGRMYVENEIQNNILNAQSMMQTPSAFASNTYEQQHHNKEQSNIQNNIYTGKSSRLQYINTSKVTPQQDISYTKYNTVLTPSQTAPETVSLLQQPIQNQKYTSTIVISPRSTSGYTREKCRPRITHYSSQLPNSQYNSGYGQMSSQVPSQVTPQPYERQTSRSQSNHIQYMQPTVDYKPKSTQNVVNPKTFKMPSPPPLCGSSQQVSNMAVSDSVVNRSSKEQYRSHSLPIGSQLNPNWTITVPSTLASSGVSSSATVSSTATPMDTSAVRLTARPREDRVSGSRRRSRSTSGGVADVSSTPRPPPLTSVGSEGSLPKASVMLAHLLSSHHSQSHYKLNSNEEVVGSDPTRSPARMGQPSPIGSDVMSPHQSLSPPPSPTSPRSGSPRESRRTHMHAEQKRRYNIKNGFDTLQALIPHLNNNPTAKISKAAMLQKGAEYIKQLKAERNQIKEDMESLRQQIECLNNSISNCHSMLPATGAPVSRARAGRLREMFARHVANRTMHNWKYWLFSVVAATLVDSFSACVSCGSGADLVRTTLLWADQHCSLVEMRPAVLNSLRVLCTTTDILTHPERLPEEARAAVASTSNVKTEPT